MTQADDIDALTSGLRALEMLVVHAPLDLGSFARLNGLAPVEASALIAAFEVHGFAERSSCDARYVPTGLTMRLVAGSAASTTAWLH